MPERIRFISPKDPHRTEMPDGVPLVYTLNKEETHYLCPQGNGYPKGMVCQYIHSFLCAETLDELTELRKKHTFGKKYGDGLGPDKCPSCDFGYSIDPYNDDFGLDEEHEEYINCLCGARLRFKTIVVVTQEVTIL